MTAIAQHKTEAKLLAETENEIARLKNKIVEKENELNELRLELGKAAIKFENHKPH